MNGFKASRRGVLATLGASATSLAAPSLGFAQAAPFPTRPIRFIVPWTPGGPSDATARALAAAAGRKLGVPIVIENKPGAAGTLGPSTMARGSRPDGYTICQMPINVFRYPAMATADYDPVEDFSWIIMTSGYTFASGVRADAPWANWGELVAAARARPGALAYASNGIGGTPHVTMSQIATHDGTDMLNTPFRGWADSLAALLGGQVQLMSDAGPWAPLVEAGRVRVLVTWGEERSRLFPDVPTLKELGYGLVSNSPYGIAGPKGMDPAIMRVIHDAFHEALSDREHVALLERLDQMVVYKDSASYLAYARETAAQQRELIRRLGIGRS